MSTRAEQKQGQNVLTRREVLTRPFAWLVRDSSPPWLDGAVPGRIPLSSLKDIPEPVLMQMAPILRQGWTARVCDGGISYRNDSGQVGMVSLGPEGCMAARLFDGISTLEQVAATIGAELGMTLSRSVAIVREAFLTLAMHEVYHPSDPPGHLHMPPASGG